MSRDKPTQADIAKSMEQYRLLWKPDGAKGMNLTQFNAQRTALVQALQRFDLIQPSCGHCEHFAMDVCTLHKADVPADFQKQVGQCVDWVSDGVPF